VPQSVTLGLRLFLGEMKFMDQRGQDMGGLEIKIILRSVEIGRHGGNEVRAILLGVGLAELDAADFGQGIGLVGRLQAAGQQRVLLHRLGRKFGVDAGAAEKEKLLDLGGVGAVDEIEFDLQILAEKFDRLRGIGPDAPDFGRRDQNIIGTEFFIKGAHGPGIAQVEFRPGAQQEIREAPRAQEPDERRADHAPMPRDKNNIARYRCLDSGCQ
jgi:hypothetical protein